MAFSEVSERWRERAGFWLYAATVASIFSIAISNVLLGLTLLALPWTRRRPMPWGKVTPLWVFLGLYVLLYGSAILASSELKVSAEGATEVFTLSSLFIAPLLLRRERQVRAVVNALLVVAGLMACQGLSQYLFGYGDIDRRIRGPFATYMTFSGFLLICDLLLVASMVYGRRWRSLWAWGALLVVNAALLGSYTRNAWVGLAVALAALALIRAPRLLLAFVPAALIFFILAPVPLVHRVTSIANLRDVSNYDRLCMLKAGVAMVRESPVFGIGPDVVRHRYPLYRPPTAPRYNVPHLHNSLLQLAAERGLPALASYLGLTLAAMALAWRRFREQGGASGPRADLYIGALLAILAFNVAGLFENNWGDAEVQRTALFALAIPFCLEAAEPDEEDGRPGNG
ncbi:MAG TPA: O-antigen ligase family protein [Thermoanaerobaculia bacterium]|nr:O-antigen ligase family protein [Thermoanaerobaculia bacterium]